MCCFVLVILFWIAIGSITFGFTVKNLLFITLSFGILNAMLPYFTKNYILKLKIKQILNLMYQKEC
jgi:threonine/homoserine efflux transporter RhtA